MPKTSDVRKLYLSKLKESGLTETDGKKLGLTPSEAPPKDIPKPGQGVVIPYFGLNGKQTKFYRYRYLGELKQDFDKYTTKKPQRYTQPSGVLSEAYYPPFIDWKALAGNPDLPLCITEGEFKAACATKNKVPTIGLGGVWNFQSALFLESLPPSFTEIEWGNRSVVIIFDSDASSNPQIVAAQNTLAKRLGRLGAIVAIAALPSLASGAKSGIDDFIVARGVEELRTVLNTADLYLETAELRQLNEEVVYVRDPGIVVELRTLQKMAPRAFIDHAYSTRIFKRRVESDKGVKFQEVSAAREWVKWEARAEVKQITYAPAEERITKSGELNIWKGWGVEPAKGDVAPWKKLLDHLFLGEPEARLWFERWCAYPLQNPGEKMYTAVLLWGTRQGTGKSLVGYSLGRIYGDNFTEIKDADLHGSFNDWAQSKQFVMGDEISSNDKRGASDRLKSFITQQLLRINQKYVPVYTVPDRINYYFTSNHPDAHYLEDDDRRNFIHEVKSMPLPQSWFQSIYDPWYKSKAGAAALFHHLLTLPLDGFNGKSHALMTDAKRDMIANGRSDLADWVSRLRETPDAVLRIGDEVLYYSIWRAEDLKTLYDPDGRGRVTVNGLSRELRRQGFARLYRGQPVPIENNTTTSRLWAIRGADKLIPIEHGKTLGELYDRERELLAKK